jgi:hypothetical protein
MSERSHGGWKLPSAGSFAPLHEGVAELERAKGLSARHQQLKRLKGHLHKLHAFIVKFEKGLPQRQDDNVEKFRHRVIADAETTADITALARLMLIHRHVAHHVSYAEKHVANKWSPRVERTLNRDERHLARLAPLGSLGPLGAL